MSNPHPWASKHMSIYLFQKNTIGYNRHNCSYLKTLTRNFKVLTVKPAIDSTIRGSMVPSAQAAWSAWVQPPGTNSFSLLIFWLGVAGRCTTQHSWQTLVSSCYHERSTLDCWRGPTEIGNRIAWLWLAVDLQEKRLVETTINSSKFTRFPW